MSHDMTAGRSDPLGATVVAEGGGGGGVNFSIFSRHAGGMGLLLLDDAERAKPSRPIALDPVANRTYHYWHAFVPGVRAGQIYAYRARGAGDAGKGLRFD